MNNQKIRIGKISYINASPVYYGLDRGLLPDTIEMIPDVPSALNKKIMSKDIEISPISAAFYAMNYENLLLLPDLSISCQGPVLSVILASKRPLEALDGKKIVFSPESASAASFLKMIFSQKKINPVYEIHPVDDSNKICNIADAALVIGDTALTQPWHNRFEYCIDLGQLWYEMTQLPFVFAVWAVRRSFAQKHPTQVKNIHQLFLTSRSQGLAHIDEIIAAGQAKLGLDHKVIRRYFELLHCNLDEKKTKAMSIFFDSLYDQGVLSKKAKISFFTP